MNAPMTAVSSEAPPSMIAPRRRDSNPRPELLAGGAVAALFFVGFAGWAAFAPLDAAAHASGQVTVSGHRQVIQHRSGGVVTALLVAEGAQVAAGQPLIELDAAEARAIERSIAGRVIARQAELARLNAEASGGALEAPSIFATYQGEDAQLAQETLERAGQELSARRAVYAQSRSVLGSRVAQLNQQIGGGREQQVSNARQRELAAEELDGMRRLAAQGYAPASRVRALERQMAELDGAQGSQRAEIGRLAAATGEVHNQLAQVEAERRRTLAEERRAAETDLGSLAPQWTAARQTLEASMVRSPVAGTVMALSVNTVGGVVAPGQELLQVVPRNAGLSMEVRISPRDIEGMSAGRDVEVRFPTLVGRAAPIVHGRLVRLAPDALTDPQTGQVYYPASVTVSPDQMKALGHGDRIADVRPGMPVEVLASKRKRTLLQYLFEPMTATLWRQGG